MKNKVLIVAFHFPPFSGSSGVQRTLRFSQYLPQNDWQPIVLSANPRAYLNNDKNSNTEHVDNIIVKRAFALDTARHLALKGKYAQFMALPDRWVSWSLGAIPSGIKLIRKYKPAVIWSTYPIATAHLIAWILHKLTGIPWVADFRDPMVEKNDRTKKWAPSNKMLRNSRLWIEKKAVQHASRLVFCTEGARKICEQRYPDAEHKNWLVINNGFDEKTFAQVEESFKASQADKPKELITLLHSGVLYFSSDRDPSCFFEALARLKKKQKINNKSLRVVLRASGYEEEYQRKLDDMHINDIVKLDSSIPYFDALQEMMSVDGLLVFQGYTSNPAIPAKVYEYLRAKKTVFSLADSEGETLKLLKKLGMPDNASLTDVDEIEKSLLNFLKKIKSGHAPIASDKNIALFSREVQAKQLAALFNEISHKEGNNA